MMSETARPSWGKLALQAILGGVVGAAGAMAWSAYGTDLLPNEPPSGAGALAGVGLIYGAMGLFVALGVIWPGLGSRLLNVADREDLVDQRAMLAGGAIACTGLGAGLFVMAIAGPGGAVPGIWGVLALAGSIVLLGAITIVQWRRYDELYMNVSLESGAVTLTLLLPILMIWAALAHIGAATLDPLGVIALIAGLTLLGTFIATGRRGMLHPT